MKAPSRVLVIGGTHGNEWTGVQVVKNYQEHFKKKFPGLKIEFILGNPEAYKLNKRFKDEDLNRAFQYLNDTKETYEHLRAKELKALIDQEPCLIIDLHTTTSHMGKTVILSDYNSFNLSLCAKLTKRFTDCRIIGAPDPSKKYLASQSVHGLIIEVGPVPNSIVSAAPLEDSILLLEFILEVVSKSDMTLEEEVELYEETEDINYPLNEEGEINAYIHSDLQGADFKVLKGKFSAFKAFNGQEIIMERKEELYPIFVNEAAYYPQQLAFTLCRKKLVMIEKS